MGHSYIVTGSDGVAREVQMTPEEISVWEAQQAESSKPNITKQITEAPKDLFGGPTLKEIFNGN